MPQFRVRARALPQEVAVAIGENGSTASVLPPRHARGEVDIHDIRLATAFHVAGALAGRLNTDVAILDNNDNIFMIEDEIDDLVFAPPH